MSSKKSKSDQETSYSYSYSSDVDSLSDDHLAIDIAADTPPQSLQNDGNIHFKSCLCNFVCCVLFFWTIVAVIAYAIKSDFCVGCGDPDYFWIWLIGCVVAIGLYCVCAACSGTSGYASNIQRDLGALTYLQRRFEDDHPLLWSKIECYHYETRTTTSTDSNGHTTVHTHREKVVTHRATAYFDFTHAKDVSKPIAPGQFSQYPLVKLKLSHSFTYADAITRKAHADFKSAFFRRNKRDSHQSVTHGMTMSNFQKRLLSVTEGVEEPWWVSKHTWFVMFGLDWVYSMLLSKNSVLFTFEIVKQIKSKPYTSSTTAAAAAKKKGKKDEEKDKKKDEKKDKKKDEKKDKNQKKRKKER